GLPDRAPPCVLAPGHRLHLPWRGSSTSVVVRFERCVNRTSPARASLGPGALPVQPPVHSLCLTRRRIDLLWQRRLLDRTADGKYPLLRLVAHSAPGPRRSSLHSPRLVPQRPS